MELNVQDVPGSLKDFYPNPDLRHKLHYEFAHKFLPHLVYGDSEEFFRQCYFSSMAKDRSRFIHGAWKVFEDHALPPVSPMERANRSTKLYRISDLSMSLVIEPKRLFAIVTMPLPEKPVEAFFVGAVVAGSAGGPSNRVFTLEASNSPGAAFGTTLCEWCRDRAHVNHGVMVEPSASAFLEAIKRMLASESGGVPGQMPLKRPVISMLVEKKDVPRKPWWKVW